MDLRDTVEQSEFRADLRRWLTEHLPAEPPPTPVAELFAWRHQWHRELYRAGWLGVDLPKEFGGRDLDVIHRLIVIEEMTAAGAPPIANWVGVELVAPTLQLCGSHAQREQYLPGILMGDSVWAQAFSESEAGSDLAAVTTTATVDGDGFVIDGAKRWSSWARFADQLLVLVRTGPPEKRHRALSCFIVPARAPGVTITDIPMLYGDAEESDIVLDRVRVPATALVGEIDAGWRVLMTSLSLARGMSTVTRVGSLLQLLNTLVAQRIAVAGSATNLPADEAARLSQLYAQAQALRALAYRKVGELAEHGVPGPIASTEKLLWGELSRQVADYGVELGGLDALTESGVVSEGWPFALFRGLGNAIEGGTTEIQRTTIARHVLGVGV